MFMMLAMLMTMDGLDDELVDNDDVDGGVEDPGGGHAEDNTDHAGDDAHGLSDDNIDDDARNADVDKGVGNLGDDNAD